MCCGRINFSLRLSAVRDAIFNFLSDAGLSVQREVSLPAAPDGHLRPADLLLDSWFGGRPTALDVTVVHGWQASMVSAPVALDNWRPFLRRREEAKHANYDAVCAAEGWRVQALAVGTWGGLGPEGAKVLARLAKRASTWTEAATRGLEQHRLLEAVGVALYQQILGLLQTRDAVSSDCTRPLL